VTATIIRAEKQLPKTEKKKRIRPDYMGDGDDMSTTPKNSMRILRVLLERLEFGVVGVESREDAIADLLLPLLNQVGRGNSVALLVHVNTTRSLLTKVVLATKVIVESHPGPL
jgi:hypothetical protein